MRGNSLVQFLVGLEAVTPPGYSAGIRNRANLHLAGCLPYFVGMFKLAVAERYAYLSLGAFLRAAQAWVNFYNQQRPHEGLGNLSPQQFAQQFALEQGFVHCWNRKLE
jgi:transposase InsO family protein